MPLAGASTSRGLGLSSSLWRKQAGAVFPGNRNQLLEGTFLLWM